MNKNELLNHLDKLHTTEMGLARIKRNIALDSDNVVDWCKNKIFSYNASIINVKIKVPNCVHVRIPNSYQHK